MTKIRQSNIDPSVITGNTTLNENANLSDLVLVYDQSSGTLKQISRKNLVGFPTVSSVSPTSATSGDGTGNYTFTVTGSGFTGGSATFLNTSGTTVTADTVTIDSDTQITMVIAKSSFPGSGEPYDVKVTNSLGLSSTLADQINIDQAPAYTTASGSLGSFVEGSSISVSVNATDPESAGNVTFELQSGSLPAGISLTNTAAEGGTAILSGTLPTPGSETTYSFVLRAVDAASNTSSRSFSITARPPVQQSFTASGTFAVPSGVTNIAEVLVVAGGGAGSGSNSGGGGGAGGLIYMPCYPVTPSGTITVTVGCGGSVNTSGQNSTFGSPGDPGLGSADVLTAIGGGGAPSSAAPLCGQPGGSGSGKIGQRGQIGGGTGVQPTQPGNSGAYGFGFPGGPTNADNNGNPSPGAPANGTGGGGAGGAGEGAHPTNHGGGGGVGKSYTIADGTTPVAYAAGGGGGGGNQSLGQRICGIGGTGQGGNGNASSDATANRGSGGGGAAVSGNCIGSKTGGKGIVIVAY